MCIWKLALPINIKIGSLFLFAGRTLWWTFQKLFYDAFDISGLQRHSGSPCTLPLIYSQRLLTADGFLNGMKEGLWSLLIRANHTCYILTSNSCICACTISVSSTSLIANVQAGCERHNRKNIPVW